MKILLIYSFLLIACETVIAANEHQTIIDIVNAARAKWKVKNTPLFSMKRLLGLKRSFLTIKLVREKHPIPDSEIPEEFDAREQWPECTSIRQIRNQGNCGSCWAVAAAAAFSDRLCVATEGNFTLPLSAEELLACCKTCGEGCEGGSTYEAWRYFVNHGIVTGGEYNQQVGCQPYEIGTITDKEGLLYIPSESDTPACEKSCTNPSYPVSYSNDHHKTESVYGLKDMKEIQKEIMKHGPVEAGFTVYSDFMTYKSGVYHHVTGEVLGGHAVRIIGWGVEDDTPYWLAANEWGEAWGENGFFRILRGNNECDFESEVFTGVPKL
ncbi:Cat25 [Halyomorpha halys]|nr:Cat25 [Halyomorpha halys]